MPRKPKISYAYVSPKSPLRFLRQQEKKRLFWYEDAIRRGFLDPKIHPPISGSRIPKENKYKDELKRLRNLYQEAEDIGVGRDYWANGVFHHQFQTLELKTNVLHYYLDQIHALQKAEALRRKEALAAFRLEQRQKSQKEEEDQAKLELGITVKQYWQMKKSSQFAKRTAILRNLQAKRLAERDRIVERIVSGKLRIVTVYPKRNK